jgi:hypothetical protein
VNDAREPLRDIASNGVRRTSLKGILLCWVTLLCLLVSVELAAPVDGVPFQTGEKLTYRISWSDIIDAGTAELGVTPSPRIAGALKLEMKAKTAAAVASTYPFADEFVSHFDAAFGAPSLFEKNFTEKKRVVKERLELNQLHRFATFTNSKSQSKRVSIELGTQDPVSALYVLRTLGLRSGVQVALPVLDGGTLYHLDARVSGTELITTKLGSFNTSRIEISIRRDAVLLSDRKITLWLTTDARRVPVLASVALPIGAAVIELMAQTP